MTNGELAIRRFSPGDGERVQELNERAMAETPEYVTGAPDDDLQAVPSHYLDGSGEFLVGTVSGTLVAMGAYTTLDGWKTSFFDSERTAELTRMRVDPEWQGKGVGTAVYCELQRRARTDGYHRFVLDTGSANERARLFYEHHGFECISEEAVEFGDLTLDLALYENRFVD
mgnify:CR=1 FL=1